MSKNIIQIADEIIKPGSRKRLELPVARLPTQTMLSLPVIAINGIESGPKLWLSAAIHGDEVNGVEIIRQVLEKVDAKQLRGTLIAVPIVNVFGFIEQSRYLPDRRDLNRSFPGSSGGSLAGRLARLFIKEIVSKSTHGIDLHTAAVHRINLPQIRANLNDDETYSLASTFGTSVIIHSSTRDGSLRQAATAIGKPVLLYEAGEALRFDRDAIEFGVKGVLRVMAKLNMYSGPFDEIKNLPIEIRQTKWMRSPRSGILRLHVGLGDRVEKKQQLGIISDAFGDTNIKIKASINGIVIGHVQNPLVNQGDAIVHLAAI